MDNIFEEQGTIGERKNSEIKVYIFESLEEYDTKSGEAIYKFLDDNKYNSEFKKFTSKKQFLDYLEWVIIDTCKEQHQPIIHLDCHGNDDGIGAISSNSSELITWEELRNNFRELYLSSGFKSTICMSSCKGLNVAKMVAKNEPCPYDFVTGSFDDIEFQTSIDAYSKFYTLIFSGKSFSESAVEVSNIQEFKDLKFIGVDSQTLFALTVKGYLKDKCTPDELEKRKKQTIQRLEERGIYHESQNEILDEIYTLDYQKRRIEKYSSIFFSLK